jgi:hypothetical protein
VKAGRGLEHHFPHLYSQVGAGEIVTVDVQREAVVLVLVVVVVGGDVTGFDVVLVVETEDEVDDEDFVVVQIVEDGFEDVDDEDVGVLVGAELDDEDDGGGALQGSVDSKSVATYKFSVALSVLLPVQGKLHELAGRGVVPLPKTTPQ